MAGNSMIGAGIHPGSLLIVVGVASPLENRSLEARDRQAIIAVANSELLVKRLNHLLVIY
jgi:SOS-response transcriptional repressor LexA